MTTIREVSLESGFSEAGIKNRMKILGIKGPKLTEDEKEKVISYKKAKSGGHWGGKHGY